MTGWGGGDQTKGYICHKVTFWKLFFPFPVCLFLLPLNFNHKNEITT